MYLEYSYSPPSKVKLSVWFYLAPNKCSSFKNAKNKNYLFHWKIKEEVKDSIRIAIHLFCGVTSPSDQSNILFQCDKDKSKTERVIWKFIKMLEAVSCCIGSPKVLRMLVFIVLHTAHCIPNLNFDKL